MTSCSHVAPEDVQCRPVAVLRTPACSRSFPGSGFDVSLPPFFPFSLFSLGSGVLRLATKVAAGDGTSARALGRGSYSQAGIGEPGDRQLGIQGRSGRELASNGVRGVAWARRKGETGPCLGHDPWPALPPLSGLCHAAVLSAAWGRCTVTLTGGVHW